MVQFNGEKVEGIQTVRRKRKGINGGKFDRNRRGITQRYGRGRKIKPVSDKCLRCKGKSYLHHYYCESCWKIIKEEREKAGQI